MQIAEQDSDARARLQANRRAAHQQDRAGMRNRRLGEPSHRRIRQPEGKLRRIDPEDHCRTGLAIADADTAVEIDRRPLKIALGQLGAPERGRHVNESRAVERLGRACASDLAPGDLGYLELWQGKPRKFDLRNTKADTDTGTQAAVVEIGCRSSGVGQHDRAARRNDKLDARAACRTRLVAPVAWSQN